jgi:hypothetical protein
MQYIIAIGVGVGLHYLPAPTRIILGPIMSFLSGAIS